MPFLSADLISNLKIELPCYLAKATDLFAEIDVLEWWPCFTVRSSNNKPGCAHPTYISFFGKSVLFFTCRILSSQLHFSIVHLYFLFTQIICMVISGIFFSWASYLCFHCTMMIPGTSHGSASSTREERKKDDSPFASFPKHYDKSYITSISVMTDDFAYSRGLRQLQQWRESMISVTTPIEVWLLLALNQPYFLFVVVQSHM